MILTIGRFNDFLFLFFKIQVHFFFIETGLYI